MRNLKKSMLLYQPDYLNHSNLMLEADLQCLIDGAGDSIYWNSLIRSMYAFNPFFAKKDHKVISSPILFLESVGLSFPDIRTELEKFINIHKKLLISYGSRRGNELSLLAAFFFMCRNFYRAHHLFNLSKLEDQAIAHCEGLSIKSGVHRHFTSFDDLSIELALSALGDFSDFCIDKEPNIDPDKLNIALIKCWVKWISQGVNVSAYPFILRIFNKLKGLPENHEKSWLNELNLIDTHQHNLIHFCLFGVFAFSEASQKPIHQPAEIFILESKTKQFVLKTLSYKIMLKLVEKTLNIRLSLKPGTIHTVDPANMQVVESIRIDKLPAYRQL